MKKEKNKISSYLLILDIFFCVLSMLSCIFIDANSKINLLIPLSIIKGIPVLIIIFLAFNELSNFKTIGNYRKCIIVALIFSLVGDVSIVFNFIIGGVSFLLASVFFILAFLNHYSFKKHFIFKKDKTLKYRLLLGVIITCALFSLFMLYAFLFVYPFLENAKNIFKILFPVYILFLSFAAGMSFFGKTPIIIRVAMILFFLSDVVLFFGFSFGFSSIVTIINLTLYYLSQNLFAKNIDE